jgi:hypothetical protein
MRRGSPTPQFDRIAACLWLAAAGTCGWVLVAKSYHRGDLGADFMVYYAAVDAWREGALASIFDVDRFTTSQQRLYAGWLMVPIAFRPWVYPLHYLLVMLPVGLLPPVASLFAFLATTFAGYAAALRGGLGRTLALLLAPATCRAVIAGQNSFLTAGLMIGGFRLLDRSPVLAGILLGTLTVKPQLALLMPVALIAARRWRVLAVAVVAALALVAASAALFGVGPWRAWLALAIHPPAAFAAMWMDTALMYGGSPYAAAAILGADGVVATIVQALAMLAAAACVWWAFSRKLAETLQLAILLAATMVANPHLQGYDLTFAAAAVLLAWRDVAGRPRHGDIVVLGFAWLVPITTGSGRFGAIATVCVVVALLYVLVRHGIDDRAGAGVDSARRP